MANTSSSPVRMEGRDTGSISINRFPLGAGYFSGDNDIHHSDESMVAKNSLQETETGNKNSTTSQMRINRNRQETTIKNQNENDKQRQGTPRKQTTRRRNDESRHMSKESTH